MMPYNHWQPKSDKRYREVGLGDDHDTQRRVGRGHQGVDRLDNNEKAGAGECPSGIPTTFLGCEQASTTTLPRVWKQSSVTNQT